MHQFTLCRSVLVLALRLLLLRRQETGWGGLTQHSQPGVLTINSSRFVWQLLEAGKLQGSRFPGLLQAWREWMLMHTELPATAPPPHPPAQAPCSSISLQPYPVSASICCSHSLLAPQVSHLSSSTRTVMPVMSSQAQNQSSFYQSYSLSCSSSTQRPWLLPYCFYQTAPTPAGEQHLHKKTLNKSSPVLFPGV